MVKRRTKSVSRKRRGGAKESIDEEFKRAVMDGAGRRRKRRGGEKRTPPSIDEEFLKKVMMEGQGRKRKHHHKKRGGLKLPTQLTSIPGWSALGLPTDFDIKTPVKNFVENNSVLQGWAPGISRNVPAAYLPSKLIKEVEASDYIDEDMLGGLALPAAKEVQDGIVEGLQALGMGRRRKHKLTTKRRRMSAKKRNAKFAHKKRHRK